ncbi:uncharacterized protein LOC62_02G002805 [Vanrija pseudolonga]|uniref:Uncharacterized protein n=1 Tax=Vanrija pseudolonga TaxID=143232 RepID=A0AAF0Y7R7_9TREE|nr:hypothetical protein LOC62_02G002805 [Vanrija pseudolonga]
MALNTVLGGPGPSTQLFRQLRLGSSRLLVEALSTSAPAPPRHHRQATGRPAGLGIGVPVRHASTLRPRQLKSSTQGSPILVPPPAAPEASGGGLDDLRSALEEKNLGRLMLAWGDLVKLQGTNACLDSDYAAISNVIDTALSNPKLQLRKLHAAAPKQYGYLRHMAIEAAAHDKWQGLHRFQLELMAFGLPTEAASTFLEFKQRRRAVEGKEDSSGLGSYDRAVRLATRLSGEGLQLLILVHIATLSMLDHFDNERVADLLDTTADFRPETVKSLSWTDIKKSLSRAGGGRVMEKKFLHNLRRFELVLLVYHPDALDARVRIWAEEGARTALFQLYDGIMAASIGKDRLIVPQDLDEAGRLKYYSKIPLVADTWMAFMAAFGRLGELDRIVKMISEDIPLRNDGQLPSEHILATAVQELGFMSVNSTVKGATRKEAGKQSDLIWDAMVKAGMQSARTIGKRILVLSLRGRADEAEKLHEEGLASLRRQQISDQDIYLDVSLFTHLCRTNKVDRAVRLLATRRHSDPDTETGHFRSMVGQALSPPMRYEDQQRLYRALMKHKAPGCRITAVTYGIILRYLLEGTNDLQSACRMICLNSRDAEPIIWYTNLIRGLLGRGNRQVEARGYEAAVFILTTLVPYLEDVAQFKYLNLWRLVARPIALSAAIPAHVRHDHLASLLDSFPGQRHYGNLLRRNIMRYCVSRADGQGIPEALLHYKAVDKPLPNSVDYDTLIDHLIKHGFPQLAQDIVNDIPRNGRYSSVLRRAKKKGLDVDEAALGPYDGAATNNESAEDATLQELVEEAEEEAEDAEEGAAAQAAREFSV